MKTYAFRLTPGQDLKKEINTFVLENNIQAGVILTCVGSLTVAIIRLAKNLEVRSFTDGYEIVSLVGTLSQNGSHIHISISDKEGNTHGGHLHEGCLIHTTAEIVIADLEDWKFTRKQDDVTGFRELLATKL
jgi:predicted DNA-binding protein with PD1-like motif